MSKSSKEFVAVNPVMSVLGCHVSVSGDSSEARWTKPSRNAYRVSKKAFVIFETNIEEIEFCFASREVGAEDPERSTPPAILKAPVVICLWKIRICERYTVV